MKITLITILLILLSGCVAKKEFLNLSNDHNNVLREKELLEAEYEQALNKIDSLDYKIRKQESEIDELQNKGEILNDSLILLNDKYTKATRTAEYYYSTGTDLLNEEKYHQAFRSFTNVLEKYPSSNYCKYSQNKIEQLNGISNANLNSILKNTSTSKAKESIEFINREKNKYYLNPSDSIKLVKKYSSLLNIYEAEKYIKVSEDKMQSCYFYETTRYTDQRVNFKTLRFEIYIGKNYSGSKWLRMRTRYAASDWMFYETITIRGSNGYQISIGTDYPEKQTDSGGSGVTEWADNSLNKDLYWKLFKIAEADEVVVRYDGKYRYDMTLNDVQMKAFREIVAKYKKL